MFVKLPSHSRYNCYVYDIDTEIVFQTLRDSTFLHNIWYNLYLTTPTEIQQNEEQTSCSSIGCTILIFSIRFVKFARHACSHTHYPIRRNQNDG